MSDTELKPCKECSADANRHLRVELLDTYYRLSGWKIGVVSCENCGNITPFKSRCFNSEEFNEDAMKAWNEENSHD